MPQLWVRNAVAEGIGAFAVAFVAVMTFATGQLTAYALAQGLVIVVLVAAFGHVSGGHFNPAVTLAFFLARRIDVVGASIYWAAQLIGGIIAALVVLFVTGRDVVANGTPVPATEGDLNIVGALAIEAIAVFVVVLVAFGTILDQRAPLSVYPFAIGLAYVAGVLAIGSLTGGALNPARAFGPAVVAGEWEGIAAWLVGPLVGAVLAWLVYEFVIGVPTDEDTESDDVAGLADRAVAPTPASEQSEPTARTAPAQSSAAASQAEPAEQVPAPPAQGTMGDNRSASPAAPNSGSTAADVGRRKAGTRAAAGGEAKGADDASTGTPGDAAGDQAGRDAAKTTVAGASAGASKGGATGAGRKAAGRGDAGTDAPDGDVARPDPNEQAAPETGDPEPEAPENVGAEDPQVPPPPPGGDELPSSHKGLLDQ